MVKLFLFCLIALLGYAYSQDATCTRCVCNIESNCRDVGCIMDAGSLSCGYFQIKEPYWIDCGRPGGNWKTCASDYTCAETCFKAYMRRYGTFCTGGSTPTCQDYARIHNGGPRGCQSSATIYYGNKVSACYNGK